MSEVIQCEKKAEDVNDGISEVPDVENDEKIEVKPMIKELQIGISQKLKGQLGTLSCHCKPRHTEMGNSDQISSLIKQIVECRQTGKAKIKVEIEFSD